MKAPGRDAACGKALRLGLCSVQCIHRRGGEDSLQSADSGDAAAALDPLARGTRAPCGSRTAHADQCKWYAYPKSRQVALC